MPAFLITQRGLEIGRRYELTGAQFTIGRGTDNDLVLPDGLVSRYHGVIRQEGADMVLIDLGSTNAAMVNDVPLEPGSPQRLQHRDVVTVGQSVFSFQNPTAAGVTPPVSMQPSGEPRTLVGGFGQRAPLAEPEVPAQPAAFTPAEPVAPAAPPSEPPEPATVVSRGRGPAPEPAAPAPPEPAPPEAQEEPRTVISRPRGATPEPPAAEPEPEPLPLDEPRTVITRKPPGAVPPPPGPAAAEPPPQEEGRTVITRRPGNVGGPSEGEPPPEEEGRTVITRRPSSSDETPTRQPPHRPGS